MIGQYSCNDCGYYFEDEVDPSKYSNIFRDANGNPLHGGPPLFCPKCNGMYMTWLNYERDFTRKNVSTVQTKAEGGKSQPATTSSGDSSSPGQSDVCSPSERWLE